MGELITEQDFARARGDAAFRQRLLAASLQRLLDALKRMRRSGTPTPEAAGQIREGVALAVELTSRLQAGRRVKGPKTA
ncbi:MAG TPA: hypothetical protein VFW22_04860 [Pseudolabrys sp.]|nr:hypothetical protein [Pseudolabrys sp.]